MEARSEAVGNRGGCSGGGVQGAKAETLGKGGDVVGRGGMKAPWAEQERMEWHGGALGGSREQRWVRWQWIAGSLRKGQRGVKRENLMCLLGKSLVSFFKESVLTMTSGVLL